MDALRLAKTHNQPEESQPWCWGVTASDRVSIGMLGRVNADRGRSAASRVQPSDFASSPLRTMRILSAGKVVSSPAAAPGAPVSHVS